MITEKGTIPIGIEKDGVWHREFEIRPSLVRDTVEVAEEQDAQKLNNNSFYIICLTAKQIVRIGDISPVPVEVVLNMFDEDFGEIANAKLRLAARLRSFRNDGDAKGQEAGPSGQADPEHAEADPGAAQNQAAPGGDL